MLKKFYKSGILPKKWLSTFDLGEIHWEKLTFFREDSSIVIEVPKLTSSQSDSLSHYIKNQGSQVIKVIPLDVILDGISNVILKLLDKNHISRQFLNEALPIITGFDSKMIDLNLSSYLKTFRLHSLKIFLAQDFNQVGMLSDFMPVVKGGWSKVKSPDLMLHVWSANVPALSLWSLVCSLLVKSPSIGKLASDEPLVASIFIDLLLQEIPALEDCLSLVWWRGGDFSQSQPLFDHSDLVMAYGSNETLSSIRNHLGINTRLLGHGHKLSFSLVSDSALDNKSAKWVAEKAALDVVRYDQMGCYSPHAYFVKTGGLVSPKEFANILLYEIKSLSHRFSSRHLSVAESNALNNWRQENIFRSIKNSHIEIMGEVNSTSQVVFSAIAIPLQASILDRNIFVIALNDWDELGNCLRQNRHLLQTAGVAVSIEELNGISNLLVDLGVTRICSVGDMTQPNSGWHHDGGFSLLDLVKIADVEESAINSAELFTAYRN
jgi:hypothetical protein